MTFYPSGLTGQIGQSEAKVGTVESVASGLSEAKVGTVESVASGQCRLAIRRRLSLIVWGMTSLTHAKSLILGVDPGFSGALVWYHGDKREIVEVIPMPLTTLRATNTDETPSANGKKHQNLSSLALSLSRLAPKTRLAVIEDVHAMPDQGVVSMFRFGQALGQIQGLIASHFVPFFLVAPAAWKSIFQLSSDKIESLKMARELFPRQAGYFSRAKDDGIAEACLLAVYGHLYFDRKELGYGDLDDRPLENDA